MVVTDYNEQFLDKRGTDHLIEELKAYIDSIATGNIDLSDYVTKSELQAKLDALDINIDLSSYATKEELTNAINSIDLSAYALKTEIPSLDGLATTEYVDNAIANVPSGGGNVDLSNYYTKAETYSKTEVDTLIANSGGSGGGGSSSGGITYAFDTEIATGETWVDGRPIYMKVIDFTNVKPSSSSGYNLYMTVYKNWVINEVIDSRIAFKNGSSNYTTENPYQGNIGSTTSTKTIVNDINSYIITRGIYHNVITSSTQTTIQVFIGTNYKEATKKIYLTVKYTKP